MANITASVGNWESGARNIDADVRIVQQLLTAASQKRGRQDYHPGAIDGKISRVAGASKTVKAILAFQKSELGMMRPDGRVDVNGSTWRALNISSGPQPPRPTHVSLVTITFTHGGKIPTKTNYNPPVAATHSGMYESTVVLSGGLTGTFTGSVWPDDMMVKGRVNDGTYPVHLGFHKGGGAAKQGAEKLVVATEGIRAGLLVNARDSVPVTSASASKTTSAGINIHNGFNSKRGSDGCLTLQPSDWSRFIKLFLDAFPNIDDWHTLGTNTGKKIGELVIRK